MLCIDVVVYKAIRQCLITYCVDILSSFGIAKSGDGTSSCHDFEPYDSVRVLDYIYTRRKNLASDNDGVKELDALSHTHKYKTITTPGQKKRFGRCLPNKETLAGIVMPYVMNNF